MKHYHAFILPYYSWLCACVGGWVGVTVAARPTATLTQCKLYYAIILDVALAIFKGKISVHSHTLLANGMMLDGGGVGVTAEQQNSVNGRVQIVYKT